MINIYVFIKIGVQSSLKWKPDTLNFIQINYLNYGTKYFATDWYLLINWINNLSILCESFSQALMLMSLYNKNLQKQKKKKISRITRMKNKNFYFLCWDCQNREYKFNEPIYLFFASWENDKNIYVIKYYAMVGNIFVSKKAVFLYEE